MSSIRCSFCQHPNLADAKYCNECGNTLALKPCAGCDAINDLHAARCHVCGEAFADAPSSLTSPVTECGALPADTMAPSSASSVLRALETVEADLASLTAFDAMAAPDVANAPLRVPAPGFPKRGESRAWTMTRALRSIVVPSLVIAACVALFRADQHASHTRPPLVAARGAPLMTMEAGIGSNASMQPIASRRTADDVSTRNAVASLRATHGSIANANANADARAQRTASPQPVAADALGIAPRAPTLSPPREATDAATGDRIAVVSSPASRPAPASTAGSTTRRATRVASTPRPATPMQPRVAAPVRHANGRDTTADVASSGYRIATTDCTASVAALGLCQREEKRDAH